VWNETPMDTKIIALQNLGMKIPHGRDKQTFKTERTFISFGYIACHNQIQLGAQVSSLM
jgi:hypothetical protein